MARRLATTEPRWVRGALIGIAQSYLRGKSALVFEPYYPYHRRILEVSSLSCDFDSMPQS